MAAFDKGDYVIAMRELRPVADRGDAKAQFFLGLLYDHGKGVRPDIGEAIKWYRKAAKRGLADAQNKLGFLYAEGKGVRRDYVEAVKWYRQSAEQGDIVGKAHLVRMRFKAFVQKAERHMARSAFDNGKHAYERGDYRSALQAWRPIAAQGHARAQNNLGVMYQLGQGVPRDIVEARKWYVLAAAHGNEDARKTLDKLAGKMTPAQISEAQKLAREWWTRHAKK